MILGVNGGTHIFQMDSIFTEMDLMLGYTFALIVVSVS
jgi:hypothetical protein